MSNRKKALILFLCCICISVVNANQLYEDANQRWVLSSVDNERNYTIVKCDIYIQSNRAGCCDGHKWDEQASIYLKWNGGYSKFQKSEFYGDYKVGNIWGFGKEPAYWDRLQKGKIIHAWFYFDRVPADVDAVSLHYNGGWANEQAECDKYHTPVFVANNIKVSNNKSTIEHTDWTEAKLRDYWSKNQAAAEEGIFKYVTSSNTNYWGAARLRLAIVKNNDNYTIVYLGGSPNPSWKEGDVRGICTKTAIYDALKVERWYNDDRMLTSSDFYINIKADGFKLYDFYRSVETVFIKLYPDSKVNVGTSNNTEQIKGNGTGFFVDSDCLVTNYHVVQDASSIKIKISNDTYDASVIASDKVNDLAVVKITDVKFVSKRTPPYNISFKTCDVGTDVYAMGYPMANVMGQEIKVTDGVISSKTGFMEDVTRYQISVPIQPGNSGCPLFDKNGNVVGVCVSGLTNESGTQNVNYAIKTNILKNLLESASVDITANGSTITDKPMTEQIKVISPYVVMILIY